VTFHSGGPVKAFHENKIYNQKFPVHAFRDANFNFLAHWHRDVELILVTEGIIQIGVNSEQRTLAKGDFVICCSGDIHFYNSQSWESEVIIIVFQSEVIESTGCWPKFSRFVTPFLQQSSEIYNYIPKSVHKRIEEIFSVTVNEYRSREKSYEMLIKAHLYEICGIFMRYIPLVSVESEKTFQILSEIKTIQHTLTYLEEHFLSEVTLSDLADHANMSSSHFSRLFGRVCGTSFKTYINSMRVDMAEKLLTTTDMPIVDIALECGFNSLRTFNRVFKTQRNKTPSRIR